MQNTFSYRFSKNIWRILPDADPASSVWAVELRDTEQKVASVAVIDSGEKALRWEGIPLGMDWWSSVTALSSHQFFLHHYRYPDLPEPTDLSAFSALTGEHLWDLPNHLLVKIIDKNRIEVAAKAGSGFSYHLCDVRSGALLPREEIVQADEDQVILQEPVRYKKGNVFFDKLSSFVEEITGGHQPISIDYLEKRPFMIFSYYIYHQDKTVQYLLIITTKRELVLHEKLSEEREGMGRSTMILKASALIYLKNNNEFSSLTLSY
ncbi:DUF4905 domain-containing protein [Dyadobacter crusticola]|uniref:DUF4905 domain-containing protein n=1 Tax=Dyadobacter crusticola TaxID=292407 RepID=UPI0004E0EF0E|nr:DUF4905 domain-containing protein [Dyadobacter crusticola]